MSNVSKKFHQWLENTYLKTDEDKCGYQCYKLWKINKTINWHECMESCLQSYRHCFNLPNNSNSS